MLSLYLALSSQNDRPLRGIKKPLKRPIRALKGRTASNPRLGPRRGLRRPPGASTASEWTRRPSAGHALPLRGTPTGAGATASPRLCRGFGHLLAIGASRNPAPSRDAAAGSPTMCRRLAKPFSSGGRGSRASPEAAARSAAKGPGEDWGAQRRTLDACPERTCSVVGGGVAFSPRPLPRGERPRRACRRRSWGCL